MCNKMGNGNLEKGKMQPKKKEMGSIKIDLCKSRNSNFGIWLKLGTK